MTLKLCFLTINLLRLSRYAPIYYYLCLHQHNAKIKMINKISTVELLLYDNVMQIALSKYSFGEKFFFNHLDRND